MASGAARRDELIGENHAGIGGVYVDREERDGLAAGDGEGLFLATGSGAEDGGGEGARCGSPAEGWNHHQTLPGSQTSEASRQSRGQQGRKPAGLPKSAGPGNVNNDLRTQLGIFGADRLDATSQCVGGANVGGADRAFEIVCLEIEPLRLTHFSEEVALRGLRGNRLLMLHTHPIGAARLDFVADWRR